MADVNNRHTLVFQFRDQTEKDFGFTHREGRSRLVHEYDFRVLGNGGYDFRHLTLGRRQQSRGALRRNAFPDLAEALGTMGVSGFPIDQAEAFFGEG